jgi:protein TonB
VPTLKVTEVNMPRPVIFKDLPATFPEEDKNKTSATVGSVVIHTLFVTALILVPLLMPQRIERWQLMAYISPLPPPPPPPATVPLETLPKQVTPQIQPEIKIEPGVVVTPTLIPREIARIVDDGPAPVIGGVPGGVSNGIIGGVLSSLLSANTKPVEVAPPPPPPPVPPPVPAVAAPSAPIHVGGAVREPKPLRVVPPVYPKLASKARVKGTVVLEAVLTAEGTVDEIHVISGHPLLVQAAVDCIRTMAI